MPPGQLLTLPVQLRSDSAVAASAVRRLCLQLGLSPLVAGQLAIVASELATNLERHGGGGVLELWLTPQGLELRSLDRGPGLSDPGVLLRGQPGKPGGLGQGGPAMARLGDQVEARPREGGGLSVVVRKRLPV